MKILMIISCLLLVSCGPYKPLTNELKNQVSGCMAAGDSNCDTEYEIRGTKCIDNLVYDVYDYGLFLHYNPNGTNTSC